VDDVTAGSWLQLQEWHDDFVIFLEPPSLSDRTRFVARA
jgi:hypothetical protein